MTIRRTVRASLGAALLCICVRAFGDAEGPTSVVRLLEELRAQGANIIYSSDLVRPDMQAPPAASGQDLWARTREALAAQGLVLRDIGSGRYIVTIAPPEASATPPHSARPEVPAEAAPTPEVSVYGSRYEFGRDTVGGPHLLASADIEATPGSRNDALRAVRAVPGLATNASTRPYIRGSFVDDVLVQFDGVPLADPFHLKNFQSLVSAFDPEAVERIEIYSGGFPVRYGTKSGGVIDLEPRSVKAGYENTLGASLLAYDAATVGTSESWPVDWLATARHTVSDVVVKPVNGHEGEPQFSDTLGRVRWHGEDGQSLTLGWLLLDDRIDLTSRSADEIASARYRDEYTWLAYEKSFGDRWHSRTVLSGTWAERSRDGVLNAPGIADERLQEKRDFTAAELHSQWTYAASNVSSWDAGFEATQSRSDLLYDRTGGFSAPIAMSFGRSQDNTLQVDASPEVATYALSVSQHRRWDALETELGVRLDAQEYRGSGLRHQWSPRLNLRYDVSPEWRVYGSWGRFTQAQRVDEWRTEAAQAAPDASALAIHEIAGVAYESPGSWRVSVEAYRKRWTQVTPYFDNGFDALSLLPDLQPDRTLIEPRSSEAAGVELSVRRQIGESAELWAGYTLSHVSDDLPGSEDVPRSWDQPHAINWGAAWRGGPWRTSALVSWHRGWPRTQLLPSSASMGDIELAARNAARWANYFAVDLGASWTRLYNRGDLSFWGELTNGTDRGNECCAHLTSSADGAGPYTATKNTWMPRTLNVGVTWRMRR
ncbi:MAG: TonB-dependent receptor [Gammaproteobacteria bacterium]